MGDRYEIRKLDIESRWFYVVDTTVPRYLLLDPASIVERCATWLDAKKAADEMNGKRSPE